MKAAIYLRVSTGDQDERNQEPECLQICTARGWEPHVIRETATGKRDDRPGWLEVLELARLGQVVAVVFWSINRTGRRRVQIAHDLSELLRWRVAVVSVRQRFLDVPAYGPFRNQMIEQFAWFAEEEHDEIVARTKAALAAARARGVRLGRPPATKPDETRAALKLRAAGASWAKVAEALGVNRGAIERAVRRLAR